MNNFYRIISLFCLIGLLICQETKLEKKLTILRSIDDKSSFAVKNLSTSEIPLNKSKSQISWSGGLKFTPKNHTGKIKIISGYISHDNDTIKGELTIDMNSMTNTDLSEGAAANLISHLKSDDFFNVSKFKTAKITINEGKFIKKLENGNYIVLFDADLEIKSIIKSVKFQAEVNMDSNIKTAKGKLRFDRNDFNINYRSEAYLNDSQTFWNSIESVKSTTKDKVISDEIIIDFFIISEESEMLER